MLVYYIGLALPRLAGQREPEPIEPVWLDRWQGNGSLGVELLEVVLQPREVGGPHCMPQGSTTC